MADLGGLGCHSPPVTRGEAGRAVVHPAPLNGRSSTFQHRSACWWHLPYGPTCMHTF